jgi:hypothetical protein
MTTIMDIGCMQVWCKTRFVGIKCNVDASFSTKHEHIVVDIREERCCFDFCVEQICMHVSLDSSSFELPGGLR